MTRPELSRRSVLALSAATLASAVTGTPAEALPKVCIFSKHLQWLSIGDAAALAADTGFDGIDITVREGGHVEPARAAQELPRAVNAIRKAGLAVPMITTGIVDARSKYAEDVLRAARDSGIHDYRWGGLTLDARRSLMDQIEQYRPAVRALAALNERYGACAMYHTHSGAGLLGASIWDLFLLLKDIDPAAVSVNYDVAHATVEGGLGGWRNTASLVAPRMRGIALKDYYWEKNAAGKWNVRWCPIGEGMVDFRGFFEMTRTSHFSGPIQLHFEYPEMGGAEDGKRTIGISRAQFQQLAKHDLDRVRALMREAGFIQTQG